MKLYVLGVGDTFSEKHVTHALLLEHEGFRLAIDCPDSYRRVLRQSRDRVAEADRSVLDLFGIDDVLITHVHGDHMNGLEGVGYFKHFAQKKALNLHTIAPVKHRLWEDRLVSSMGRLWNGESFRELAFEDYFAWSEVSLETTTTIGPFTVRARTNLVVHETNYGPAHTAYADLCTLDDAIKKKMRLIHYPDEFDLAASEIPALVEGQVIEI